MQAIGRNMTLQEVENNIRQIKDQKQGGSAASGGEEDDAPELDLDEFIGFISEEMKDNEVKEELVEAYSKFCGPEGQENGITREQLQATMEAYGEKRLTKQEIDLLFEETDHDSDGVIKFEDFVRMMMSR